MFKASDKGFVGEGACAGNTRRIATPEPRPMPFRRVLFQVLALFAVFTASACAADVVRLGVTAGPHAQIAEIARKVAARDGLDVKIVEFQDCIQPNAALDAGELDANSDQHLPFLESQIKAPRQGELGQRRWPGGAPRPRTAEEIPL